ncbi:uncharacterized protein A4U43_C05F17310 [Asparagus officinalis]|uniref:Uncharacterized protein n=1 Tax=Asparagus officinalis TaxID=4686 RepID=A0A5P1EXN2_ASPOF|nr:uncharacterized protein A4U43_C05F17310 [Asparagus officinalis]
MIPWSTIGQASSPPARRPGHRRSRDADAPSSAPAISSSSLRSTSSALSLPSSTLHQRSPSPPPTLIPAISSPPSTPSSPTSTASSASTASMHRPPTLQYHGPCRPSPPEHGIPRSRLPSAPAAFSAAVLCVVGATARLEGSDAFHRRRRIPHRRRLSRSSCRHTEPDDVILRIVACAGEDPGTYEHVPRPSNVAYARSSGVGPCVGARVVAVQQG